MATARQRWDFRVTDETDRLVRDAATSSAQTLTEFVIAAAMLEAERVLADRTRFVLDEADWARFSDALDRPAASHPGLARLFARPSVFTDR